MSNRHASLEETLLRREVFFMGLSLLAGPRAQMCLFPSSDSLIWPRFLAHWFHHLTAPSQTVKWQRLSSLRLPLGSCWLSCVGQVSVSVLMLAAWRLDGPSMTHGALTILTAFEHEGTGPYHPWCMAGAWTNVFLCHASLPLPISILLFSSQSVQVLSAHPFKVHRTVVSRTFTEVCSYCHS